MTIGKWSTAAIVTTVAITGGAAHAQNYIHGSGATLFVDFFGLAGGTNDAIDVDGDGAFGFDLNTFNVDQLAPTANLSAGPTGSEHWIINYRSVGSVNGYREFVESNLFGGPPYTVGTTVPSEAGVLNRTRYAELGTKLFTGAEDGTGYPTSYQARNTGGVSFSFLDVPSRWGTRVEGGAAAWGKKPTFTGYGNNPNVSSTGQDNRLVSIERDVNNNGTIEPNEKLNFNTASPDSRTLYDTPVAFVPVVPISNRGVGRDTVKVTDWQHLAVTGRMPTGENLVATTRDTGSGTHNAWMNSLGVDPSWGTGENLGPRENNGANAQLGAGHAVGNGGGSGIVEDIVRYHRLAVGYTGLFGASRAAEDANNGRYEILNMINDHVGGTVGVRPGVASVVDNLDPNTGWRIGGSGSFVTVGDPDATPLDRSSTSGYVNAGNANPQVANAQAAYYLQNIKYSIGQFAGAQDVDNDGIIDVNDPFIGSVPNDNNQLNMPGDVLAKVYTLLAGVDALQSLTDPTNFVDQTSDPAFNQLVQDFIKDFNSTSVPAFGSKNIAGQVPLRKSALYDDGQATRYAYYDSSNTLQTVAGNSLLNQRNQVQGDFNNDQQRNVNDIAKLVEAANSPLDFEKGVNHGGAAGGLVGDYAVAHILGDFDGDGNLNKKDVRYFADGLAINPSSGNLDRKAGFVAVDNASQSLGGPLNYFAVTKSTWANGSSSFYNAGDARGDIFGDANGDGVTASKYLNEASAGIDYNNDGDMTDKFNADVMRGSVISGADGIIDFRDVQYVYDQFMGLGDKVLNFADINDAVLGDISADMNGDLVVDILDVIELVGTQLSSIISEDSPYPGETLTGILHAQPGDFNLDGAVDGADLDIWKLNAGLANATFMMGDANFDFFVDGADLDGLKFNLGQQTHSPEPGTLTLLGLAGASLMRRRRKN